LRSNGPHTAEFNDRPTHGGGGAGERSEFVWETTTVFGSAESEQDRDIAVLLLGVLLPGVVQFVTGATVSAWSIWGTRRPSGRRRR